MHGNAYFNFPGPLQSATRLASVCELNCCRDQHGVVDYGFPVGEAVGFQTGSVELDVIADEAVFPRALLAAARFNDINGNSHSVRNILPFAKHHNLTPSSSPS